MAPLFDPYHKWLGIPGDRRPPSAYDLLGISPGERDPEVIDAAVVRQSAYVRNFQSGRYSNEATRLLNEIAEAREVLLDPARRQDYDVSLTRRRSAQDEPPGPIPDPATLPANMSPIRVGSDRRPPRRRLAARVGGSALLILAIVLSGARIFAPRRAILPVPVAEPRRYPPQGGGLRAAHDPAGGSGTGGPNTAPGEPETSAPDGSLHPADATTRPSSASARSDLDAREPVAPNGRPADRAPAETPAASPTELTLSGTKGDLRPAEGSEQDRYYDRIAAAQRELRDRDTGRARETLTQCPPTLRGWEWDYLLRQCRLTQAASQEEEDRVGKVREGAGAGHKPAAYRWDEGRILRGHRSWVSGVKFSPDDRLIATSSGDGSVKIWDAATGQPLRTFVVNPGPVHGVAFSPSGLRVASAGNDGLAKIWDVRSSKILVTLRGHGMPVADVSYRADGNRIATASMDGTVKIWNAMTGKVLANLESHGDAVGGVDYSPDGHRVASASEDGVVRVWDADDGRFLLALRGHGTRAEKVAYSPDGRRIAATSKGGTVRIWDATTGRVELTLRAHSTLSIGLAFSPDGRRIASAGWDCVRLWDAATGREVLNLTGGHTTAFSHDGRRLLSNHGEGGIEAVVRDAREGEGLDLASGSPASLPSNVPWHGPEPTAPAPGPRPKLIPIYQLNHPSDLLLTTNAQEIEEVSQKGKYRLAAVGYGFGEAQPGTVQLWRYFVAGRGRHLYTTSKMEMQGLQGGALNVWVYSRSRQGTVPVTAVLADGGVFYVYPKDQP